MPKLLAKLTKIKCENMNRSQDQKNEILAYINANKTSDRAIRKDAVIIAEWTISLDQSLEQKQLFFEQSIAFFAERYGENNIAYTEVERSEHPRVKLGIVPLFEGRLSAKSMFNRAELLKIQSEMPVYLHDFGLDIVRGQKKAIREQPTTSTGYFASANLKCNSREISALLTRLENAEKEVELVGIFKKNKNPTGRLLLNQSDIGKILAVIDDNALLSSENERLRALNSRLSKL